MFLSAPMDREFEPAMNDGIEQQTKATCKLGLFAFYRQSGLASILKLWYLEINLGVFIDFWCKPAFLWRQLA
jgi:hypothetical protein